MADDLIVKISADAKQFNDEVDKITSKTEDLNKTLKDVATVSGAVFAGLVASATVALKAFSESEKASIKLRVALENNGLAAEETAKQYKEYANAISEATGVDDDAIVAAQAKLQTFIGQNKVTKEATAAIVDLATETGSLDSAAEKLGLAFQGNVRGLKQYGIKVDENATAQDRLSQAIAGTSRVAGGQAAALAKGTGSINITNRAFDDLLKKIGAELAPSFEKLNLTLAKFLKFINKHEGVIQFATVLGTIIAVLTGLVLALTTAAFAFTKVKLAIDIARIAITFLGGATRIAVGATGIGLLLLIAQQIYEHWSTIFPLVKGIFVGAVSGISGAAAALGKILGALVEKDFAGVRAGYEDLKKSVSQGIEVGKITTKEEEKKQGGKDAAAEAAIKAEKDKKERILQEKNRASDEFAKEQARLDNLNTQQSQLAADIAVAQAEGQSAEVIKLKQEEKDVLQQLEAAKTEDLRAALEERQATIQALAEEAQVSADEQQAAFNENTLANNAAFQQLNSDQQDAFLLKHQQQLEASQATERTARDKFILEEFQAQQARQARLLQEQQKYGIAYATINSVIQSDEIQGLKKGAGELVQLTQSKNATLKQIGKIAAVTSIVIKTAESAVNIYAGFSAIPIIGPVLGIAGAAAAVAFGAEQIGNVTAAQAGGIVPGINRGGDSVPALLQPGELVVPRQNFSQITQAIANEAVRQDNQNQIGIDTPSPASSGSTMIAIGFDGSEAEKVLTARRVEARSLGTLREVTA